MPANPSSDACRLPLVAPEAATDATVHAVYAEIEHDLGFGMVPNVFRAMAGQPAILRATWDLFRSTVLEGDLPRVVKEMIGVIVSAANDSEYALNVHLHSLSVQGISEDVLAVLSTQSVDVPGVAPSVAAMLRLAHTAAHDGPLAIGDADIENLLSLGVTREELAELFAAIDLFQYVNSFTDLAHVPLDAI